MDMLKLTIKPGEYINIGNDIKVIFSGGSANNMQQAQKVPTKQIRQVRKQENCTSI